MIENQLLNNLTLEIPISQYKVFYKKYLLYIENRQNIVNELELICREFTSIRPKSIFSDDPRWYNLDKKTNQFLQNSFKPELVGLYNKQLPEPKVDNATSEINDTLIISLLKGFTQTFVQLNEIQKKEYNYKSRFVHFLLDCLNCHGLHSNILLRDSITSKRFNLIIHNFFMSEIIKTDCKTLMTYEAFDKEFINQYSNKQPIKIGGKLIPFDSIYEIKITTTLLKNDEIELFAEKNNFIWSDQEKDILKFIDNSIDETETYHPNPFEIKTYNKGLNVILLEETKQLLTPYSSSNKLFQSALQKFNNEKYERNVLDDLRLSLEKLLSDLFNNKKSLENQLSYVGEYQKQRGATKELTNMFNKLLEYYTKYQNNYVKHNDGVNKNEIEFVIDLTITFIKYLIK